MVANARTLAEGLLAEGFGVVTGGTDTHLLLADPAPFGIDGRTARGRLAGAGLVLDSCALPHVDARGIRLGTAAVTTQGMGEAEMARIAVLFAMAMREDPKARAEARELAERFPLLEPGEGSCFQRLGTVSQGSHKGRNAGLSPLRRGTCNHPPDPNVLNNMRAKLGCGAEMASDTSGAARA